MKKQDRPNNETDILKLVMEDAKNIVGNDQMTVFSLQPITWNDSSLGLAEDDFAYLQVLTPGLIIKLKTTDKILVYHTDMIGNFRQAHHENR